MAIDTPRLEYQQWAEVLGRVTEPLSAEDLEAWSVRNLPDGTVRP